jgi:hypothetical protein
MACVPSATMEGRAYLSYRALYVSESTARPSPRPIQTPSSVSCVRPVCACCGALVVGFSQGLRRRRPLDNRDATGLQAETQSAIYRQYVPGVPGVLQGVLVGGRGRRCPEPQADTGQG